ncbi:hypothetical protein AB0E25_30760 [Streptomyces bobili]|uniref:hypothetical protein n=1 Tax=Streptomyces bobili TaxID=67280 RepID=UPI0033CE0D1B
MPSGAFTCSIGMRLAIVGTTFRPATSTTAKNDRLNHAGHLCAFASLKASPGANTHYRRRRESGDWHA